MEMPTRNNAGTVSDLIRIIIADEKVIMLKNADLKALRDYCDALEQSR